MDDDNDFQRPTVPPWRYVEEGPFVVFAVEWGKPSSKRSFDRLADAVRWFVRFHVGPIDGRDTVVMDANLQILVGYAADRRDGEVAWMGSERGFAVFATEHDPMTVAIWERLAGGDAGLDDVPYEAPL